MAYIGNQIDTGFTSLLKQDLTGASGTTLTLSHSVANANDIALYINNVRQEPTTAYTVNNTTVNLTGTVSGTDDIYVIYLARAVQTTVPPDGSVSTAKIADSAVTTDKIVDSSISSAKIADGSVTTAKLQSGASFNPITNLQFWRINSSVTSTTTPTVLTNYTDAHNTSGFKRIGTAWTVSSGVFTPSTSGVYQITFVADLANGADARYIQFDFNYSTNSGSSYTAHTMYAFMPFVGSNNTYGEFTFPRYYNISDASTFRFRVKFSAANTSQTLRGGADNSISHLSILRLADAQ